MLENIHVPTLLINEKTCRQNIQKIAEKAARSGVKLRPHFKTHQSRAVGQWCWEAGVRQITTSSLSMAQYFAQDWEDITVAFPVNIREMDKINKLAAKIQLNLLAESSESLLALSKALLHPVGIFFKIDVGTHRTGIDPQRTVFLRELIHLSQASEKLHFKGFLAHAGHAYRENTLDEISLVHQQSLQMLQALKKEFIDDYPELILSSGDTPTASRMDDFSALDEIRTGNLVFYDIYQQSHGNCQMEDIAVCMACPVVAKHPERGEIVVYGGAVHFSKDFVIHPETAKAYYGQVAHFRDNAWQADTLENYMAHLSQEHGILKVSPKVMEEYQVGDLIGVLPIHSCLTANLMRSFTNLQGDLLEAMPLELT